MIDRHFITVNGLKKEPFSGSHNGMRYLLNSAEDKTALTVFTYPEPWTLEKTAAEEISSAVFPLTEEGLDQAVAWLHEQYQAQKARWQYAAKNGMHIAKETSA